MKEVLLFSLHLPSDAVMNNLLMTNKKSVTLSMTATLKAESPNILPLGSFILLNRLDTNNLLS